jgi:hypothetical protein
VPATSLYRPQVGAGALDVSALKLTLPAVTVPVVRTTAPTRRVRARVTLGVPGSRESKRGTRRLKIRVRVTGQGLRSLSLSVADASGRRLGTATARSLTVSRSRLVTVRLSRPVSRGRYRIGARFVGRSGARGAASRILTLG